MSIFTGSKIRTGRLRQGVYKYWLLLLSLVLFYLSWTMPQKFIRVYISGHTVNGAVETYRTELGTDEAISTYYRPYASYLSDNRKITCKGLIAVTKKKHSIGQQVKLIVDPADPHSCAVDGYFDWQGRIIGSITAVVIAILAFVQFVRTPSKSRIE